MNLLTVQQVSKSFTDKVLFDKVSIGINEGDKIGVLGINGTGKSTFLKIIAGKLEPDEGQVVKGKEIKVAYLAQNPEFDYDKSILENVVMRNEPKKEGWNLEGEAKAMLQKLGIPNPEDSPAILSGGGRKRAALVQTLLTPADILVLDEPTNHLDNEMAEWLEDYLKKYRGAFVMITHDRYFLDKVTNRIVEIDKGNLYTYQSNYSGFLELKAAREESELATERKNKSLYRQELEWMKRGARARSTKQKARIDRFETLKDRKGIEETKQVELSSVSSRLGKKTIEINAISKSYGERQLIKEFTYIMLRDDRLGIVGPNGCGKSTLLNMITENIKPDQGTIEIGPTVKIGYFAQENEALNEETKVIDEVKDIAEYLETPEGRVSASMMLERFLFTPSMQYSKIGKLSGGEKRRLYLLKVLMGAPNVLILDEPTNDLDIQTLTILEDYLDSFDGIVVTVSHDRYFLDRVVNRIFAFEGNGLIKQYEGNYTDYKLASKVPEEPIQSVEKKKKASSYKVREAKLKFTYAEQKEYNEIDSVIEGLEQKLEQIEQEMLVAASEYSKLQKLSDEKDMIQNELEEKMERWVYLNDLATKIAEQK